LAQSDLASNSRDCLGEVLSDSSQEGEPGLPHVVIQARLEDMTINAEARLVEAREKVWFGEVAALEGEPDPRRHRAEAEARCPDVAQEFS